MSAQFLLESLQSSSSVIELPSEFLVEIYLSLHDARRMVNANVLLDRIWIHFVSGDDVAKGCIDDGYDDCDRGFVL